ncbi:MAG: hypothetical protein ACO3JI_04635, partial [Steroidobacteraceae bacterium]
GGVGAVDMAGGMLASGAEGARCIGVSTAGAMVGATVDSGSGVEIGGEVAGFNKTNASTTRLIANNPSSTHTHDGVLLVERSAAAGSADGFC